MNNIIDFEDAIKATEGEGRTLLIGNGFSSQYFSYSGLLDAANLDEDGAVKRLFLELNTVDFEVVIRALENAVVVEQAYGNIDHAVELEADAKLVRESLVAAVNATHPLHRSDLRYESAAAFLKHFQKVFSLNYDLLLYWVNLEKCKLRDGFGLNNKIKSDRFRGPFQENASCDIYNLHGGLHLFQDKAGDIYKALNSGEGVIANITRAISMTQQLPLYVAEGASDSKMRKIKSNEYLRRCYETLQKTSSCVFIFGHSAAENDAHIYRAIFSSNAKHVYFGIFHPDAEKVRELDAELGKYKTLGAKNISYTFFDSETAHVWGCSN